MSGAWHCGQAGVPTEQGLCRKDAATLDAPGARHGTWLDARHNSGVSFAEFLRKVRFRSLQRGDFTPASKQPIENTDAWTAAMPRSKDPTGVGPSFPPDYVPPADDGRPQH